jgi:hypothetical protein
VIGRLQGVKAYGIKQGNGSQIIFAVMWYFLSHSRFRMKRAIVPIPRNDIKTESRTSMPKGFGNYKKVLRKKAIAHAPAGSIYRCR